MDLTTLKYDISLVPDGKCVIDKFPDLATYKEFSNRDNDHLLKIAFLATDEGSPFLKKDRDDYEKRITSIFDYLKLDDKELLSSIVLNSNEDYSAIVNRFFVMCDNLAYVMWSDNLFNFHMIGVALRQPPSMNNMIADMEKRAKLQNQRILLHEQLVELEQKIFPDSTTRKIARKEVAKILQFPEKMAQPKSPV